MIVNDYDEDGYHLYPRHQCPACGVALERQVTLYCPNGCDQKAFYANPQEAQPTDDVMIAVTDEPKGEVQSLARALKLWFKARIWIGAHFGGWKTWRVKYNDGVHTGLLSNNDADHYAERFGGEKYIDYNSTIYKKLYGGELRKR